jgi:hypothetical protein
MSLKPLAAKPFVASINYPSKEFQPPSWNYGSTVG